MNAVHPNDSGELSVEAVVQARKVARWMVQGILPSVEQAQQARDTLTVLAESELADELDMQFDGTRRTVQAGSMGVLPSQKLCIEASEQLEEVLYAMRHGTDDSYSMRQRYGGMAAN